MNKNDRSQNTSLGIVGFGAFGQLAALHLARHFEITAYDPSPEVALLQKSDDEGFTSRIHGVRRGA